MTKPRNVTTEIRELANGIRAARWRDENRPQYVLQSSSGRITNPWPRALSAVRTNVADLLPAERRLVCICRLEPVRGQP